MHRRGVSVSHMTQYRDISSNPVPFLRPDQCHHGELSACRRPYKSCCTQTHPPITCFELICCCSESVDPSHLIV